MHNLRLEAKVAKMISPIPDCEVISAVRFFSLCFVATAYTIHPTAICLKKLLQSCLVGTTFSAVRLQCTVPERHNAQRYRRTDDIGLLLIASLPVPPTPLKLRHYGTLQMCYYYNNNNNNNNNINKLLLLRLIIRPGADHTAYGKVITATQCCFTVVPYCLFAVLLVVTVILWAND